MMTDLFQRLSFSSPFLSSPTNPSFGYKSPSTPSITTKDNLKLLTTTPPKRTFPQVKLSRECLLKGRCPGSPPTALLHLKVIGREPLVPLPPVRTPPPGFDSLTTAHVRAVADEAVREAYKRQHKWCGSRMRTAAVAGFPQSTTTSTSSAVVSRGGPELQANALEFVPAQQHSTMAGGGTSSAESIPIRGLVDALLALQQRQSGPQAHASFLNTNSPPSSPPPPPLVSFHPRLYGGGAATNSPGVIGSASRHHQVSPPSSPLPSTAQLMRLLPSSLFSPPHQPRRSSRASSAGPVEGPLVPSLLSPPFRGGEAPAATTTGGGVPVVAAGGGGGGLAGIGGGQVMMLSREELHRMVFELIACGCARQRERWERGEDVVELLEREAEARQTTDVAGGGNGGLRGTSQELMDRGERRRLKKKEKRDKKKRRRAALRSLGTSMESGGINAGAMDRTDFRDSYGACESGEDPSSSPPTLAVGDVPGELQPLSPPLRYSNLSPLNDAGVTTRATATGEATGASAGFLEDACTPTLTHTGGVPTTTLALFTMSEEEDKNSDEENDKRNSEIGEKGQDQDHKMQLDQEKDKFNTTSRDMSVSLLDSSSTTALEDDDSSARGSTGVGSRGEGHLGDDGLVSNNVPSARKLELYRWEHMGVLVSAIKTEWHKRFPSFLPLELYMGYFGIKRLKQLLVEVPNLVLAGQGGLMRTATIWHAAMFLPFIACSGEGMGGDECNGSKLGGPPLLAFSATHQFTHTPRSALYYFTPECYTSNSNTNSIGSSSGTNSRVAGNLNTEAVNSTSSPCIRNPDAAAAAGAIVNRALRWLEQSATTPNTCGNNTSSTFHADAHSSPSFLSPILGSFPDNSPLTSPWSSTPIGALLAPSPPPAPPPTPTAGFSDVAGYAGCYPPSTPLTESCFTRSSPDLASLPCIVTPDHQSAPTIINQHFSALSVDTSHEQEKGQEEEIQIFRNKLQRLIHSLICSVCQQQHARHVLQLVRSCERGGGEEGEEDGKEDNGKDSFCSSPFLLRTTGDSAYAREAQRARALLAAKGVRGLLVADIPKEWQKMLKQPLEPLVKKAGYNKIGDILADISDIRVSGEGGDLRCFVYVPSEGATGKAANGSQGITNIR